MAEASLIVSCPGCGTRGRVRPEQVGRTIRCPRCQETLRVKESATPPSGSAGQGGGPTGQSSVNHSGSSPGEVRRLRLHALKRRLAGPERELGPVRGDAALKVLERMEGIRIPSEYRAFLRIVGDGGAFGPRHGLRRPGEWAAAQPGERDAGESDAARIARRQTPFPFSGASRWAGKTPEKQERYRRAARQGVLELGSEGCGIDWLLVLTGPQRGRVWLRTSEGVLPCPGQLTFLPWLELLLGRQRAAWRTLLETWEGLFAGHPARVADLAMCRERTSGKLEPIALDAPLCAACVEWLAERSAADGRVRCVSDPLAVTMFEPDGAPITLPHASEPPAAECA